MCVYVNYELSVMLHYKVCKESIQMEELIRNHAINFYAGEINFGADGIAEVTCEQSPKVLDVQYIQHQVKTIKTKFISDVAIVYCATTMQLANYKYIQYLYMHIAIAWCICCHLLS